jgi:hypothetical protein
VGALRLFEELDEGLPGHRSCSIAAFQVKRRFTVTESFSR